MDIAVGIGTVALQGLHVVFGALGVLVGLIALVMRKGRATHRAAGTLFVWCMGFTALGAIVLAGRRIVSTPEDSIFWVTFGSVTLYLIATAAIAARRRDGHAGWGDWLAAIAMILVSGAMMTWSADLVLNGRLGILPALFAFAAVGFAFAISDFVRLARRSRDPLARITRHMIRALGALIGALTAFAIQNGEAFPPIVPPYVYWCIPAALLIPIGLAYRIRIARGRLRVPGLVLAPVAAEDAGTEPEFVEAPPRDVPQRIEPQPEVPQPGELPEPPDAPEPPFSEPVRSQAAASEPEMSWSDPASVEFPMKPEPDDGEPTRDEVPSAHYVTDPGR